VPGGPGIRLDGAVTTGNVVSRCGPKGGGRQTGRRHAASSAPPPPRPPRFWPRGPYPHLTTPLLPNPLSTPRSNPCFNPPRPPPNPPTQVLRLPARQGHLFGADLQQGGAAHGARAAGVPGAAPPAAAGRQRGSLLPEAGTPIGPRSIPPPTPPHLPRSAASRPTSRSSRTCCATPTSWGAPPPRRSLRSTQRSCSREARGGKFTPPAPGSRVRAGALRPSSFELTLLRPAAPGAAPPQRFDGHVNVRASKLLLYLADMVVNGEGRLTRENERERERERETPAADNPHALGVPPSRLAAACLSPPSTLHPSQPALPL
jgi:hypothetical protein